MWDREGSMSQHQQANITLQDVALAERELRACYERVQPLEDEALLEQWGRCGSFNIFSLPCFRRFCRHRTEAVTRTNLPADRLRAGDLAAGRSRPPRSFGRFERGRSLAVFFLGWSFGAVKDHELNAGGLSALSADLAGFRLFKTGGKAEFGSPSSWTAPLQSSLFPRLARMLLQGIEGEVLDPCGMEPRC